MSGKAENPESPPLTTYQELQALRDRGATAICRTCARTLPLTRFFMMNGKDGGEFHRRCKECCSPKQFETWERLEFFMARNSARILERRECGISLRGNAKSKDARGTLT